MIYIIITYAKHCLRSHGASPTAVENYTAGGPDG
jgi:hypothetical protein